MIKWTLFIFLFITGHSAFSQELNCVCTINVPNLQKTDPKVFDDLRTTIIEFLNNQKWSDDLYEPEEKIDCNLILNILTESNDNVFEAELAIQASRPVYGSNYSTALFSHNDKDIKFKYLEFQPLLYSENSYVDNLSSLLSYYAYLMIGLDYDSFSPLSGEKYFLQAQQVINLIPQGVASGFGGWLAIENNQNRYWIIESLLNPQYRLMRKGFYDYHLRGLDVMSERAAEGKDVMLESLTKVKAINDKLPNAVLVKIFAQTKGNEVIEIFKEATRTQKRKAYDMMSAIDASNTSRYSVILN